MSALPMPGQVVISKEDTARAQAIAAKRAELFPVLLEVAQKLTQASQQASDALEFSEMVDEFIFDCNEAVAKAQALS